MDIEDVETIAVLGAGTMGHGIAEVAAIAGYAVKMRDVKEEFVEDGYENVEWSLEKLGEKGQIADPDAVLERIEPLVDLEAAVGDADVVIEAVPERMDVKREVYGEVEEYAPDRAIFVSNTSSLSISEMAEATGRPERFCGMHFFNPVVRLPLVEVVAGRETSEATLELVEALARSMDKTPIRVRKDEPGFVVNRILVPLINEAAWLIESERATVEAVDATTGYAMGLPMGAFELADQIGIDVTLDVLEYMHDQLGPAYEPCPLLEEHVETERLGRKSGAGFYDYDDGGASYDPDAAANWIETRLLATMANETAKLVAGDVADPADVDAACRLGANFPTGPARLADDAGLEALQADLESAAEETGAARYEPADALADIAARGGFYPSDSYAAIQVEREGNVGRITLDRPSQLNTIDVTMLSDLERAVEDLTGDDAVRAILLSGAGRAFSAGGALRPFVAMDDDAAREISERGQAVFEALATADVPVVAAVDGHCLGGGMELAAAADLRVAAEGATFSQPERDLGLLPGWGGTQRLPRIVGESRAAEIVLTGRRYDAETMAEYGFLSEVVEGDELDGRAEELAGKLAAGPPIAQAGAKRAMRAGRDDFEAGLAAESEAFAEAVDSEDGTNGVRAFLEDESAAFEGR
jgi:enoyl-CoA hydratase/3-hydroxyacyl-CoA dehydrogenase